MAVTRNPSWISPTPSLAQRPGAQAGIAFTGEDGCILQRSLTPFWSQRSHGIKKVIREFPDETDFVEKAGFGAPSLFFCSSGVGHGLALPSHPHFWWLLVVVCIPRCSRANRMYSTALQSRAGQLPQHICKPALVSGWSLETLMFAKRYNPLR